MARPLPRASAAQYRSTSLATLFQLLERARPVAFEKARERAVGEELPAGLAVRAVVGLVFGVHDALHRGAAHRARLAVSPMHCHPFAKRGDVLGKPLARLL